MESIIPGGNEKICYLCGRVATERHHCIHGSNRNRAEEDGLTVWLCTECHTRLHSMGEYDLELKKVAQRVWEKLDRIQTQDRDITRANFIRRYGRNYL